MTQPCWSPIIRKKKTETRRKIVEGSRKACREFAKGIGKLAGNMSGDYRKKTIGLAARMPEAAGLAGESGYFRRLTRPGPVGFGLHPKKIGSIRQRASRRRTREWT
ncbi:hypothetical protein BHE74_00053373 [Ensete ventricosum]|nr:hypothetical protein BHE74_00053373 [Ensete ventricosum]RZS27353.1 hypothetical protein BHM03_00060808 [Ensete ventricosum]